MRKYGEVVFDVGYIALIFGLGIYCLLCDSVFPAVALLFGAMAFVLGIGDVFHLYPRIYGLLWGKRMQRQENVGKIITSVTSSVYYGLLYLVWVIWFEQRNRMLDFCIIFLITVRIIFCCLPYNRWFSQKDPLCWRIIRNIPFILLGILCMFLFMQQGDASANNPFYLMPAAVFISFCCYVPVVLFGGEKPALGMLMMPKTVCYIWIQVMGIQAIQAVSIG